MIAYLKALLMQLFAVPVHPWEGDRNELLPYDALSFQLYHPEEIKHPDDDITPPQVCPMNEGDQLCIHRSANDAEKLLAADKLGYRLTLEVIEKCHYQDDYDHYSVEKI
jgi:hypothetical protein